MQISRWLSYLFRPSRSLCLSPPSPTHHLFAQSSEHDQHISVLLSAGIRPHNIMMGMLANVALVALTLTVGGLAQESRSLASKTSGVKVRNYQPAKQLLRAEYDIWSDKYFFPSISSPLVVCISSGRQKTKAGYYRPSCAGNKQ